MKIKELKEKLRKLEEELLDMEGRQMEALTQKRIESDMGDDYRENEQAKLVMEQHDIWYIRKVDLKREIAQLRHKIRHVLHK
jgi:hypothetical protein